MTLSYGIEFLNVTIYIRYTMNLKVARMSTLNIILYGGSCNDVHFYF